MNLSAVLAAFAAIFALPVWAEQPVWDTFNGDLAATKFADAPTLTPDTIATLERAWEVRTGDVSDGSGDTPPTVWSATPIYANQTLYLGTPFYRILALDPATGAERWRYDTKSTLEALTQPALKNRGVAYWESGQAGVCEKRVLIGTMDAELHAVDADTGAPCVDFGADGILNVNQWNDTNAVFPFSLLQPPTVVGDTILIGWAGKDWAYTVEPPGNLIAVDARTGALKWDTGFIPPDLIPVTGTANIWSSMSADPGLGLVYVPVSSPSPNYWGGNRTAPIPLATSIAAIDIETGQVVWNFQHVHHDIWDYDTPSAPTLVNLTLDGQVVPALVQTTKQGFIFVLDRRTGVPLFPIEERPVPASDADGEQTSPTQPFADVPRPTVNHDAMPDVWPLADTLSFGQCSKDRETYRYEGLYTPPSVQGSFLWPATAGGNNWGGAAVDPRNGILYVNTSQVVQVIRLIPRANYEAEVKAATADGSDPSGNEAGFYAQEGSPYGIELFEWRTSLGLPCWKPPFGTFSAYDLNTGARLYAAPFGLVQQWGFYGLRDWGSPTLGGPVVTSGGVVLIGASMDNRVRALDAATGRELWSDLVAAPAVSIPAVFTHDGTDYVVWAVGGNSILKPQVADQIVAYRLPVQD